MSKEYDERLSWRDWVLDVWWAFVYYGLVGTLGSVLTRKKIDHEKRSNDV